MKRTQQALLNLALFLAVTLIGETALVAANNDLFQLSLFVSTNSGVVLEGSQTGSLCISTSSDPSASCLVTTAGPFDFNDGVVTISSDFSTIDASTLSGDLYAHLTISGETFDPYLITSTIWSQAAKYAEISGSVADGSVDAAALEDTAVTPGTYGTTLTVPQLTVDQDGRITDVQEIDIAVGGVGTITGVTAGAGLSGGGVSGNVTLSLSTPVVVTDGGTGASTAAGARTNLGLGTIATQDSNSVTITGGSVTGITDITVADGGTGASTAAGARTNLGLGGLAILNAVGTSEVTDNDITATDLSAILTFADGDYINLSQISHDDAANQGLQIPNLAVAYVAPGGGGGEGFIAWDPTNDRLMATNGSGWNRVGNDVMPATQVLVNGDTVVANACGTLKRVSTNDGTVTTDTTNTFTAPSATNAGCCMDIVNIDTATTSLSLDRNANFKSDNSAGAAIVLGPHDTVRVCSTGAFWYQVGDVMDNS